MANPVPTAKPMIAESTRKPMRLARNRAMTTSASKALGLAPTTVDGAVPGDLLVFDATSLSDLIARQPGARRLSEMLQGELI